MSLQKTETVPAQQMIRQAMLEQQARAKKEKVERFRRLNPFAIPGQIVFAGSSLMEQFPVHELLQDRQLSLPIYNRGIGGYTTQELLDTMQECIYDLKPAAVFINIGTNDMNGPDYDRRVLLSNYEKILLGIRENLPQTQVYTLSYFPVNPAVGRQNPMLRYRTNERIQDACEGVKALAERLDMHYVDVNAGLADEAGNLKAEYTIEGVHMYGNGYRVVLDNLLPVLTSIQLP